MKVSKSDRYVPTSVWTSVLSVLAGLGMAGMAVADSAMTLDPIEPSTGLQFGDLIVSPYFNVLYIYDSNYDRSKNGTKAESANLKPGFDFNYENEGPHKFSENSGIFLRNTSTKKRLIAISGERNCGISTGPPAK